MSEPIGPVYVKVQAGQEIARERFQTRHHAEESLSEQQDVNLYKLNEWRKVLRLRRKLVREKLILPPTSEN